MIPAIRKLFENVCLQSLALTKVTFNDFPLRYDSMAPEIFLLGTVDFE